MEVWLKWKRGRGDVKDPNAEPLQVPKKVEQRLWGFAEQAQPGETLRFRPEDPSC